MDSPDVRLATPADRDRVTGTVVAAFAGDPAFRYFFPEEEDYAALATGFAGQLFDERQRHDGVWVVDDGSAVAMWNPPGPAGAGPPRGLSQPVLDRIRTYDAAVHVLMPTEPHWYLGVLATHPDHAGRRWGRAAMLPGLELARAAGLPAYLETATDTNVGIYVSSGWEVVEAVSVGGVHVRIMRHEP